MRTCILALALVGLCSAQNYGRFVATPGSAPKCFVQGGRTIVQYSKTFHKSFHCSHDASGCSCTETQVATLTGKVLDSFEVTKTKTKRV